MNSEFDHLFKVLLLGDSGVGKSCIILRYIDNIFNSTIMNSIGVDFKLKYVDMQGKTIKLQIWDTAGQERFRTITTSYYRGAHAIAIVYDITDRGSFEHVKSWMVDIEKYAKENVLRFLVGNKCDLIEKREVMEEEGKELARFYNVPFIETSAKESINTDEFFGQTMKTLLDKTNSSTRKTSAIGLNKRNTGNTVIIDLDKTDDNNKDSNNCCAK